MDSSVSSTTIPALFPGDLVCMQDEYARPADRGIVFEIVRVNPRNWRINPVNGDGSALRCPPEMLRTATDEEIAAARAEATHRRPPLQIGQVVEVSGDRWRESPEKLWTVIKTRPGGAADVAELGSSKGRVYREIPRGMIDPLPEKAIVAMLAAAQSARH